MDKHMKIRALCHEVATHGPKNWRDGLLEELKAALIAAQQPDQAATLCKCEQDRVDKQRSYESAGLA